MKTSGSTNKPAGKDAEHPTLPKPKKWRIFLVDDHPLTREGLAANIERREDLAICGEASGPAEAMSTLPKAEADLVVTDMTMPGRSGIEFIKDLHALMPQLPILVLSMHDEMLYAERALRAGARGFVMKDSGAAKVLEAIRTVLGGGSYVSAKISARLVETMAGRRPTDAVQLMETLSDRELEIFQLIGTGRVTKEIAETLHLSPKTVDVHRSRIKEKLALRDSPSLVHAAVCWVEKQGIRR